MRWLCGDHDHSGIVQTRFPPPWQDEHGREWQAARCPRCKTRFIVTETGGRGWHLTDEGYIWWRDLTCDDDEWPPDYD